MQRIKKGDKVIVTLGKDHGKEGLVDRVLMSRSQVVIAGINVYKKHIKKGQANQTEGTIVEIIKPINLSNIALICPECQKPTRVGIKIDGKNKVRICRKCKKEIK